MFDIGHEALETTDKELTRSAWRQKKSTPAMRLRLVDRPVRLDTILYGNWPEELLTPAKVLKKRPPRPPDGEILLDRTIPFR